MYLEQGGRVPRRLVVGAIFWWEYHPQGYLPTSYLKLFALDILDRMMQQTCTGHRVCSTLTLDWGPT